MLKEEVRTLQVKSNSLETVFSKGTGLINTDAARFYTLMLHWSAVGQAFRSCVEAVERMLLDQLVAAIGKHVCICCLFVCSFGVVVVVELKKKNRCNRQMWPPTWCIIIGSSSWKSIVLAPSRSPSSVPSTRLRAPLAFMYAFFVVVYFHHFHHFFLSLSHIHPLRVVMRPASRSIPFTRLSRTPRPRDSCGCHSAHPRTWSLAAIDSSTDG